MFKAKIAFETKNDANNFLRICEKSYPEITKISTDKCILEIEGNFEQFPKELIIQLKAESILECIFQNKEVNAYSINEVEFYDKKLNYREKLQKLASKVDSYFEFIIQIETLLNFDVQEAKVFEIYIRYECIDQIYYGYIESRLEQKKASIFAEEGILRLQEDFIINHCEKKIHYAFQEPIDLMWLVKEVRKYNYFEFNRIENNYIEQGKTINRRIKCLPEIPEIDKNLQMLDKSLPIKERLEFVCKCLHLYVGFKEDFRKALLAIIKFKNLESNKILHEIKIKIIKLEMKGTNTNDARKKLDEFSRRLNNTIILAGKIPMRGDITADQMTVVDIEDFFRDLQAFVLTDEELQKLDAKPPINILNLY